MNRSKVNSEEKASILLGDKNVTIQEFVNVLDKQSPAYWHYLLMLPAAFHQMSILLQNLILNGQGGRLNTQITFYVENYI